MFQYEATAYCFGDNINTDYIISSRRKKDTIDPSELAPYLMEDIRPGFFGEIKGQAILVAGENFGCGSLMEVAAQIVYAAGIKVILAKSFARGYYRNAVNNGIMPIVMDTSGILEGDTILVEMDEDSLTVTNGRTHQTVSCPPFRGMIGDILKHGGLVPYRINKRKES